MGRPKQLSYSEICHICMKAPNRYIIRLDDKHKEEYVKKALICLKCYKMLFRQANKGCINK